MENKNILIVVIAVLVVFIIIDNFGINLTGAATTFPGWGYCNVNNPCGSGYGDCDKDADCKAGLKCVENVGDKYGWSNLADVCEGVKVEEVEMVTEETETITYGGNYQEIPLGDSFHETTGDKYGALWSGDGLKVQTSLTALEDDYQTDVVLEVDKDSIRYALSIPSGGIIGKQFNFLGNWITFKQVLSDTSVSIEINNQFKTVRDGDAFIGENLDDPNWVWDLANLYNNPVIAIENDFIYNDDSDNPPKVGECIYLPNNYANICLDSLNVNDNDYNTYTIELDENADLSDANAGVSEKTIYIHSSNDQILLLEKFLTNNIWITGDGRVYYEDINDYKVKYLSTVGVSQNIGKIVGGLNLLITKRSDDIIIYINYQTLKENIGIHFEVRDGEVESLGGTNNYEEASELTWEIQEKGTVNIGTKDEDLRTAYGIIIRDPKSHGASDEVVLDIPSKQVKAMVSMSFRGGVTPTPQIKDCYLSVDCFLNSGDKTLIDGKTIKLIRVGSAGAVVVDVDGKQEFISSKQTQNFDGVGVYNKETYYDSNNQAASGATIVVSQVVSVPKEVTYQGVLDMLNSCDFIGTASPKWLSGDKACEIYNKKCVFIYARQYQWDKDEYVMKVGSCDWEINPDDVRNTGDFLTMCCSAP